jgi:MoaA/NifB/PqqE/SkfB family radical SAM enzyme
MCNAVILEQALPAMFSIGKFINYSDRLKEYRIPVCSISGGEPTLVPDMPEILRVASKRYSMVTIMTNLYGKTNRIERVVRAALENNVNIIASFDGFGEVADRLRGAKNVAASQAEHIRMISKMKQDLRSSSVLTINTVVSDLNLNQVPSIFEFSAGAGWNQTLVPVNVFADQEHLAHLPHLTYSAKLDEVCDLAMKAEHVKELHSFLRGIPRYARREAPKVCPYLTKFLRTYKIYLEPNGDISFCKRVPVGNINDQTFEDIVQSTRFQDEEMARFKKCTGCWMQCFVEPALALQPENLLRLDFLHRIV